MQDLKRLYNRFLETRDDHGWQENYVKVVTNVKQIAMSDFKCPQYQKYLWELDLFNIGLGNLVRIPDAYKDAAVAEALWTLRAAELPSDHRARALFLDKAYYDILGLIFPRYSDKRPMARLARIFAVFFPNDILCLMDASKTTKVMQLLDLKASGVGFIGQHVYVRDRLRTKIKPERNLAEMVSYSIFTWFLLTKIINAPPGGSTSEQSEESVMQPPDPKYASGRPGSVFIVHGHDEGAQYRVATFLERLGIRAIILHEQLNMGSTIIEKVEREAAVGVAVVLLTPDDLGGKSAEDLKPRARQNVIFELGYFMGKLGRDKVIPLTRGPVELPTDFAGVAYTPLDEHGGWQTRLGRELQKAGFEIDWNKVMRG